MGAGSYMYVVVFKTLAFISNVQHMCLPSLIRVLETHGPQTHGACMLLGSCRELVFLAVIEQQGLS